MTPPLSMTLEPRPGADVENTCREAQRLADLLRVTVKFRFNGVLCGAQPGGDWSILASEQQRMMGSNHPLAIATSRRE